ncbi:MAG: ABC-type sugar transport system substrate-binding protein [Saprospiraceae bacterium]|jgi:ABC-type sugar transport system substrate-binding protein|tara:strand:+ start:1020 stop:1982 length:963 start_codon:yes stop_codon:yes gene_type:complete
MEFMAAIKKTQLVFILALLLMTAGCDKETNEEGKGKIAVVISSLNNPWFLVLGETAANKAKELGYEAYIFDSQNNSSKEAEHFENIIASGYKAILFNATDADGSVLNVKRAKKAGIPTFCMDREINSRDVATTQLLSDNFTGCVRLGEYFVREMNKKGSYVELLGLVGDNNTWNRSKGFHSVVDEFPELKMVSQQNADFDRNKAMEVMESILQANPDIDGVFCGNDAMAMGAYQGLLAAGKSEHVQVFGFDGNRDALNAIADNKIKATVMQFPKIMASKSAELADRYLMGERGMSFKTLIDVQLITKENVGKYNTHINRD